MSDPRAQMLKAKAEALAKEKHRTDEMRLFEAVEGFRQASSFPTRTEAIRALLVSGLEGIAKTASDERAGERSEGSAPGKDEGARE